jgi:hypothetical protein
MQWLDALSRRATSTELKEAEERAAAPLPPMTA